MLSPPRAEMGALHTRHLRSGAWGRLQSFGNDVMTIAALYTIHLIDLGLRILTNNISDKTLRKISSLEESLKTLNKLNLARATLTLMAFELNYKSPTDARVKIFDDLLGDSLPSPVALKLAAKASKSSGATKDFELDFAMSASIVVDFKAKQSEAMQNIYYWNQKLSKPEHAQEQAILQTRIIETKKALRDLELDFIEAYEFLYATHRFVHSAETQSHIGDGQTYFPRAFTVLFERLPESLKQEFSELKAHHSQVLGIKTFLRTLNPYHNTQNSLKFMEWVTKDPEILGRDKERIRRTLDQYGVTLSRLKEILNRPSGKWATSLLMTSVTSLIVLDLKANLGGLFEFMKQLITNFL